MRTLHTPLRVLDSRDATGTSRGLKSGDVVVDLGGEVPVGATAAVLNVTVTRPTAHGHLVAFPAGSPMPATSNVNFGRGQTQANAVVVPVPDDRRVVLHVSGAAAHVIVDLLGWTLDTADPLAGSITALASPQRQIDTRTTARRRVRGELPIALGRAVPAAATSVLLNVTLTAPEGRGFAVVFPTGSTRPGTSNVNVDRGQTQANEVLVAIGRDRSISVFVDSTSAAVVVDLVGFVTSADAQAGSYVPLSAPEQIADSRQGRGLPGGLQAGAVDLRLPDGVPSDATAVLLTVIATGASRSGFVTVFPAGTERPATSNVNFAARSTHANVVLVPVGASRRLRLVVDGRGVPATNLVVDLVGYLRPVG